jgi:hypothetical protein
VVAGHSEHRVSSQGKLIAIEHSRSVRINGIETTDFKWIFDAFGAQEAFTGISPKILLSLLGRSFELVRHDIPRTSYQADFQMLEHAVANQEQFAKLFGITTISNPSMIAATYPYALSAVAKRLGFNYWRGANALIDRVKTEKQFDMTANDNKYHVATKYGKSIIHKYSEETISLLKKVKKGEQYDV